MKKVLVFGCNGFVGKYLFDELKKEYEVFGADVADSSMLQLTRYYKIDLCDVNLVINVINEIQPEYIINLAAISSVSYSWNHPQETINVNLIGTLNILDASSKLSKRPERILLIGSSEEYAFSNSSFNESSELDMNNPYGVSKVAQEKFAEFYRNKYNLDIICTRTFNHTGVGQNKNFAIPSFVSQIVDCYKSGKNKIYVGDLSVVRDIGDVRDMVSAYRLLLTTKSFEKTFNVGSGNPQKLLDIVKYLISLTNKDIEIVVDPTKLRLTEVKVVACDNSLIKKEIGWEPKFTVYDAIKNMFEFYMNQEND